MVPAIVKNIFIRYEVGSEQAIIVTKLFYCSREHEKPGPEYITVCVI